MDPIELGPDALPVGLRVLAAADYELKLIDFYHIEIATKYLNALLHIIFVFNIHGRIKLLILDINIKTPIIVFFWIDSPLSPHILHSFGMFYRILQYWILWIEILMVHSDDDIFAKSTRLLRVKNHELVITRRQKATVDEEIFARKLFFEVWRVYLLNIG